jgi:hypothetical protein
MKMLLIFGGLIGALLLAPGAFAADGDQCENPSDANIPLFTKGNWIPVACVNLCDNYAGAADAACDEWDFADTPGMPDIIVLEYDDNGGDCGGFSPDFTFQTGPITGGTPAYDIDSSTVVLNTTTDRIIIITEDGPLDRFLFTTVADDDDCTDVDVRMFFYNRKTGFF